MLFAGAVVSGNSAQASEITPDTVIELVNIDRAKNDLPALQAHKALTMAAEAKAYDMDVNAYFAHTSPQGVTPWYWVQKSGYEYRFAGENLAIHFTDAQEEEDAWMASVKHRENILNQKYQDIGVAVRETLQNGQKTTIVVQMFGLASGVVVAQKNSTHDMQEGMMQQGMLVPSRNETIPMPVKTESALQHNVVSMEQEYFGALLLVLLMALVGGSAQTMGEIRILMYGWLYKERNSLHRL